MQVSIKTASVLEAETDAAVIFIFQDQAELLGPAAQVDEAMNGAVRALLTEGDLKGGLKETAVLYPSGVLPAKRVVVTGMGKVEELTPDRFRQASSIGARRAGKQGARQLVVALPDLELAELTGENVVHAGVEGVLMGLYKAKNHKSTNSTSKQSVIEAVMLVPDEKAAGDGLLRGEVFADAVCTARDLVNQPGNHLTPTLMADVAKALSMQSGLDFQVFSTEKLEQLEMGAMLGVAKGSEEPPCFMVIEHSGGEKNSEETAEKTALPTIVLIGKGITFDSGGISLKPRQNMDEMKTDMAGAAAVIAVMQGVARLALPLRVIGLVPAAENLPSSRAYKPGDVLTAMNRKTIEVISTDAEGRMLLADALCYAARFDPESVITVATLTGACVVALGEDVAAGIFATHDTLCDRVIASGDFCGEKFWRLPLYDEYKDKIKSDIADMKNAGGQYGGVGTSAIFLKEFASAPWAHLDIAGMALTKSDSPYIPKGGTGFSVRTLLSYLLDRSREGMRI